MTEAKGLESYFITSPQSFPYSFSPLRIGSEMWNFTVTKRMRHITKNVMIAVTPTLKPKDANSQ